MAIFILFILIYQVMLVMEVLSSMRKLQRCLDEFGEHYSKLVVGLAVAIALLEPFLFEWPFMITPVCRGSVYRAQDLMVAASHCALAVAPLAYASCARKKEVLGLSNLCLRNDLKLMGGGSGHGRKVLIMHQLLLLQRATATAIAVACVLTAKDAIPGVPSCILSSLAKELPCSSKNAALALTSIFPAFLPSILNFLPLWSTVLHLSSSDVPRFYACFERSQMVLEGRFAASCEIQSDVNGDR
ncbi:cadmium/zinc-transporting ATPase HMA1 [Populus alba x Populus x berolinensis]|uniref:Cadmium/zinc-transporting ATPase HMA1 n=1 Tax=Populus alba x Populus x berolinensis TaxID=444605 RepID=A0AAD6QVP8_9ROSI|nr:cadmium/zinc-transporting ATPase HMA1 [Populus alba x Populus x berolinensis]